MCLHNSQYIKGLQNRGGKVEIGENSKLGCTQRHYIAYNSPTRLRLWEKDAIIKIGERCHLNGVNISARKLIEIGDDAVFACVIQILDTDEHCVVSINRTKERDIPSPVIIGNNVWIGLNALILKGTIIGDNCVVGAGAVVKGKFPANCVIAGNPAKIVKRFEL